MAEGNSGRKEESEGGAEKLVPEMKNRQILEGSSDSSKLCLEKSQARSAFEAREGQSSSLGKSQSDEKKLE